MDDSDQNRDVKIHAPDKSLQVKIGAPTLDQVLAPGAIAAAQNAIAQSSDRFIDECMMRLAELDQFNAGLQARPADTQSALAGIVAAAFSIKSSAAIGGYDLVSALAKSLHLQCEQLLDKTINPKNLEIVQWHVTSIGQLLRNRMKGTGGAAGTAIMAEIERMAALNQG